MTRMTISDPTGGHRIRMYRVSYLTNYIYYSNNNPPRHNSYYGDNDIFSNFRDFADIKGDAKEYNNNNYDEGYYYR